MVSHCVAKEVQRNAKWGYLVWIRRADGSGEESGRGGKRERAWWEKNVSEVGKERGRGGKEERVR